MRPGRGGMAVSLPTKSAGFHGGAGMSRFMGRGNDCSKCGHARAWVVLVGGRTKSGVAVNALPPQSKELASAGAVVGGFGPLEWW